MAVVTQPLVFAHASEELLEEYIYGRISGKELAILEDHLLMCSECQDALVVAEGYIAFMRGTLADFKQSAAEALVLRAAGDMRSREAAPESSKHAPANRPLPGMEPAPDAGAISPPPRLPVRPELPAAQDPPQALDGTGPQTWRGADASGVRMGGAAPGVPLGGAAPLGVSLGSADPLYVPRGSADALCVPMRSAALLSGLLSSGNPLCVPLRSAAPDFAPMKSANPDWVPMKSAAPVIVPLWFDFRKPSIPHAPVLLTSALFVLLAGGLMWNHAAALSAPPATVTLIALRGGDGGIAHAPPGRPLTLVIDGADLPADVAYGAEVVSSAGDQIWTSHAQMSDQKLAAHVSWPLAAGVYWVRLYSSGGQLLREFGLHVGQQS